MHADNFNTYFYASRCNDDDDNDNVNDDDDDNHNHNDNILDIILLDACPGLYRGSFILFRIFLFILIFLSNLRFIMIDNLI